MNFFSGYNGMGNGPRPGAAGGLGSASPRRPGAASRPKGMVNCSSYFWDSILRDYGCQRSDAPTGTLEGGADGPAHQRGQVGGGQPGADGALDLGQGGEADRGRLGHPSAERRGSASSTSPLETASTSACWLAGRLTH